MMESYKKPDESLMYSIREVFDPEGLSNEIMAKVQKEVKFPKNLPDSIKQILYDVLIEQKRLVMRVETAKNWNNQEVYETQVKLCADATVMPRIWQLACNKGEKELVKIITALPRIYCHDGTPPIPLSKETKENAQIINKHLKAIINILQKDDMLKISLSRKMNDAFKTHALDTAKSEIEKEHGAYSECLSDAEKQELKRKWQNLWFSQKTSIICDEEKNTTGIIQNPFLAKLLANLPSEDEKQENKIPYIPYDKAMFDRDYSLYHPHTNLNRAINNGNTADVQFALAIRSIERAMTIPPDCIRIFEGFMERASNYQTDEYIEASADWDNYVKSDYHTSQGTKKPDAARLNRIAKQTIKQLRSIFEKDEWKVFLNVLTLMDDGYNDYSVEDLKNLHRKRKNNSL